MKRENAKRNDLGEPLLVDFEDLYLDPNNPRIAPVNPPGYNNAEALFDESTQKELVKTIKLVYKEAFPRLMDSIQTHGFVSIDSILVWEHPEMPQKYVVPEGNTRITILKTLREKLEDEHSKLRKLEKSSRSVPVNILEEVKETIENLELLKKNTTKLWVYPIKAATAEDLIKKLPRLLGIRHITSVREWTPYATNLYIVQEYERLYRIQYGEGKIALKDDLIQQIRKIIPSLTKTDIRKRIQAAIAFTHFQYRYADKLPNGETFSDRDQYFFSEILEYPFTRTTFNFGENDLQLSDEMEEVLFAWAFCKPRNDGKDNPNILTKAEDMYTWQKIKKYDETPGKHTSFAAQLDVNHPDEAVPISQIELDFKNHKNEIKPEENIKKLIDALGKVDANTLMYKASHLRPLIAQLLDVGKRLQQYLEMQETHTESTRK